MYFTSWDAERIAAWKSRIAGKTATKEGLRAEIFHYFARQGHHDPDRVLHCWSDIATTQDSLGRWMAWLETPGTAS
ncbi:hypothetical protein [Insolitispirillum peregrinum]|uniref:Uncharacterized protein n=1 Tax=Insolitispirillum peregrinum TaxID=80876 RepID=A0A1N7LPQ2_9PROT|nr:hypothetical protein [Insolitispirillum peregrinum]SIS75798.1 hypothetical protein SAMN05421779_103476 [Insolitispirillum peregrinum]